MRYHTFQQFEETSDAIDKGGFFFPPYPQRLFVNSRKKKNAVNELKGMLWDSEVQFSKEKDTSAFRQYLDACDRVKLFYQEQHGSFEVK